MKGEPDTTFFLFLGQSSKKLEEDKKVGVFEGSFCAAKADLNRARLAYEV